MLSSSSFLFPTLFFLVSFFFFFLFCFVLWYCSSKFMQSLKKTKKSLKFEYKLLFFFLSVFFGRLSHPKKTTKKGLEKSLILSVLPLFAVFFFLMYACAMIYYFSFGSRFFIYFSHFIVKGAMIFFFLKIFSG